MTIDMSYEKQLELERQESFEDGKKEGMEKGLMLDKIEMIILKVKKNKPLIQIASELEKEPEAIKEMYDIVVANPGKAAEEIYDIIQKADLIAK